MNPYTDILVSFLHGFRSSPFAMKEIVRAIPYKETSYEKFPQRIRYNIPFLSLGEPSLPLVGWAIDVMNTDRIQDYWIDAEQSVYEKGRDLSKLYNELICHNGSLLLVAHSLGTEVAVTVLKNLRIDIQCHFIVLGGVASASEIEGLINERPNLNVHNFLNTYDAAIEGFYEGLGGVNSDCAGRNTIKNAHNHNFNSIIHGHSGYLTSSLVKRQIKASYELLSLRTPRTLRPHSEYIKLLSIIEKTIVSLGKCNDADLKKNPEIEKVINKILENFGMK